MKLPVLRKPCIATMNKVCSLCLAMAFYIRFNGISFVFFGELEYPKPENYD